MAFEITGGWDDPLEFPDFDTKALKKGFRKIGREVAKRSRKLVSRKAISSAGEFPGKQTGGLSKTIKYKATRRGNAVVVHSFGGSLDPYYPAFVYYGHRAPYADMSGGKSDRRQRGKKRVGQKVADPRKNWIVEAASDYANTRYLPELKAMLDDAIVPGLVEGLITK